MKLAAAIFRVLLRLLPAPRRAVYGDDMAQLFSSLAADAGRRGGGRGIAILIFKEMQGMMRFSIRERRAWWRARTTGSWHPLAELRWAWRGLAARRRQAVFAIALLLVTLGANGVVFSVADSLAFTRDAYPEAERLVIVQGHDPKSGRTISGFPADLFTPLRAQSDLLSAVHGTTGGTVLVIRDGEAISVRAAWVTPGLFEMLGARPLAGRTFTDADRGADAMAIAVIRADLAREHFGDPRRAVGQTLDAATGPLRIVGVMPSTFRYPGGLDRLWRPYDLSRRDGGRIASLFTVARVAPGITADQLRSHLTARSAAISPQSAMPRGWPYQIAVAPFGDRYTSATSSRVFWFLLIASGALLITACASIASVELAVAVRRARTFAVASALGASRAGLVRIVLCETGLLAAAALAGGAAVATWGTSAVAALLPESLTFQSTNAIDLDARALAFMAIAGAVTWLVAAIPVLLYATRRSTVEVLRVDTRSGTGTRGTARVRRLLAGMQVAVAVCLLIGATLGVRSYLALITLDPGIDTTNLFAVEATIPPSMPRTAAAIEDTSAAILNRLAAHPAVAAATRSLEVPPLVWGDRYAGPIELEGREAADIAITMRMGVTPDYFEVLRVPLRAGRTFAATEPATSAIVTETFAQQYWPGEPALGKRFKQPGDKTWLEIVGVTGRIRNETDRRGEPSRVEHQVFVPWRPRTANEVMTANRTPPPYSVVSFAVRLRDAAAVASVRDAVRAVDDRLLARAEAVDDLYAALFLDMRVGATVVSAFGVLAFAVALAGIYGVMAFLVAGRGREIAIRMALGAAGRDVRRQVLASALTFVVAGAIAGVLAAWALSRFVASQLSGVSPTDAPTYAMVTLLVVVAAVVATWQPARRAARIDPAAALRGE